MINVYQERLMDHYRNPRFYEPLSSPDFSSEELNPSCGDSISVAGIVEDGILKNAAFNGAGCVISQAAASLLLEHAVGISLNEIAGLDASFMKKLIGMELGPLRLKCALLSLHALQVGINNYQKDT